MKAIETGSTSIGSSMPKSSLVRGHDLPSVASLMLNEDLPYATLTGTNFESLAIQYRQENGMEYAEFAAQLSSPNTRPPIEQTIETSSYNLRDATDLDKLLDGDSTVRFELGAIHFDLFIYEHTWGVRYGYIAETNISTITWGKFAPWPNRRKIGNYLLDETPTAGCIKLAFLCDYDALREFAKQLHAM